MKRLFLGAVLAMTLALAIPAAASAAEYETYVGCGTSASTPRADVCVLGDAVGAFFEADEETEYEVCVEFPDGFEDCAEEQEAEADVLYVNGLFADELGTYHLSWYVGPTEVGSSTFRLDPRPAPPAPPVLPPAPAPAPLPVAPVKTVACTKAEKRVKQLKNQLRNTSGHEAKAKVRGKLQGAKATVKRAC